MSQLRVDDMIKCILIIQLDNALGELKLESLYKRREAMALKFVKKSLGNYNFSKLFPLREAKHGMKARMSEKYFVTPSRTKRHKDSAVPYLQNLLNKDHLEKRQTLKKLFSCKSSHSYASIELKKRVNYISNVDVIT